MTQRTTSAEEPRAGQVLSGGEAAAKPKLLELPAAVTVKQLADLMGASPIDVIKQLMRSGVMAAINQAVNFEVAAQAASAFGFVAKPVAAEERKTAAASRPAEGDAAQLVHRPPVVTILGHVDHGKTTLLDAIRQSRVAASEVGGITQRIGAYQVEYEGHKITFLDTPGHEAFTAMRARGAQVTDIAVLVVAADDGVMPQTVEAIDHVKAAGVPIVVAINKVDKPDADVEKVKRQLLDHGLVIEEWGGEVVAVPVSAKAKQGISDLLENILVVAEVAELKANPNRQASGVVIEARLDKSQGPVATVLVHTGTLKVGDNVVVNGIQGRVKAMLTADGKRVKQAGPATPVEILGISDLPQAGDTLTAVPDERTAKTLAEEWKEQQEAQTARRGATLEEMFAQMRAGKVRDLNIILKADVQGSVEALRSSLERLSTEKSRVRILHFSSGTVTESDVLLAVASKAIILAFNTGVEPGARRLADTEGVEIRFYQIIYELLEDVRRVLEGLIEPVSREVVEGRAEVRAVFSVGQHTQVAGVFVVEGRVLRNAYARVLRQGKVLHQGAVRSLRHYKEDVREMASGFECGVGLDGFNDFQVGDIIEIYRRESSKP